MASVCTLLEVYWRGQHLFIMMGWRLLALCRNVKDPRADAFRFVRQVLASNDKRWGRGTGGFIPGRQTLGSNDAVYRLYFFCACHPGTVDSSIGI